MSDTENEILEQLATLIRTYRERKSWSQREFGKRVSMNWRSIQRWEAGERSIRYENWVEIAHVLGIPRRLWPVGLSPAASSPTPTGTKAPSKTGRTTAVTARSR